MLTNMFYEVAEVAESVSGKPKFLVDQLDLIGGVQFIFIEVCISFNLNLDIPPIVFIITNTFDPLNTEYQQYCFL